MDMDLDINLDESPTGRHNLLCVPYVAQHVPHFQHATSTIDNIVQVAKGRVHIHCAYVRLNNLARPSLNRS